MFAGALDMLLWNLYKKYIITLLLSCQYSCMERKEKEFFRKAGKIFIYMFPLTFLQSTCEHARIKTI